jgi:hypothetical protein
VIRDHFIPVAVDAHYDNVRPDLPGKFFRKLGFENNGMVVATPAGKLLESGNGAWIAGDGLKKWQALSPEERRKELSLEPFGAHDPAYDLEAPAGTTVLKMYIRRLVRDKSGRFTLPESCHLLGVRDGKYTPIDQQPQRDYLWITREEVQALFPEDVQQDGAYPLPESVVRRLLVYHLPYTST